MKSLEDYSECSLAMPVEDITSHDESSLKTNHMFFELLSNIAAPLGNR
jgi:hypothetical protein